MEKLFLKIKHWQFFLLFLVLPMILQSIFIEQSFNQDNTYSLIYALIMLLFLIGFFGWMLTIGFKLNSLLPRELKFKTGFYKFSVIFPLGYMFFLYLSMGSLSTNLSGDGNLNPALFPIIFVLHLFTMFCIFYILRLSAKILKTFENQEKTSFGGYAGEFFLMWFFPLGIWIIQPRVNKIYEKYLKTK